MHAHYTIQCVWNIARVIGDEVLYAIRYIIIIIIPTVVEALSNALDLWLGIKT